MLILATLVHKLKQNKQNFTHYASLIMIFFPKKLPKGPDLPKTARKGNIAAFSLEIFSICSFLEQYTVDRREKSCLEGPFFSPVLPQHPALCLACTRHAKTYLLKQE